MAPILSESGLSFQDLIINSESQLTACFARTWKIQLREAQGIPLPGVMMSVLERKAYVCLFDGKNFLSNVYEVGAIVDPRRDDKWKFITVRFLLMGSV